MLFTPPYITAKDKGKDWRQLFRSCCNAPSPESCSMLVRTLSSDAGHDPVHCAAGDNTEQFAECGAGGPFAGGGVDADAAAADPQSHRLPCLHRRGGAAARRELL